ncbi:MAG TPA: type III-B CRISPR module-associated protein Cmr5, partial [Rheinheimera sp.]|uniref:type III-B CRISPR module-associated protein Cmr5 n=1 Tax=Rheinheimera sp. TaxID=1869214 RepID=UPI002F93F2DC
LAKGKDEHIALLNDLAQVLSAQTSGRGDGKALHQRIIDADAAKAMLLTRQALDASGWLKRYVQGVLKVDATGGSSAEQALGAE